MPISVPRRSRASLLLSLRGVGALRREALALAQSSQPIQRSFLSCGRWWSSLWLFLLKANLLDPIEFRFIHFCSKILNLK